MNKARNDATITNYHFLLYIGSCNESSIRLAGSSVPYIGRVEICIDQQWTVLCQSSWWSHEAQVVCRELGYSGSK